jgi:hypothetical protein
LQQQRFAAAGYFGEAAEIDIKTMSPLAHLLKKGNRLCASAMIS